MTAEVVHEPGLSRFVAVVDGDTAVLAYERTEGRVAMTHTVVPRHLEGRGIAGALTRTAVDWARSQDLVIDAQCSYVRQWLAKHG